MTCNHEVGGSIPSAGSIFYDNILMNYNKRFPRAKVCDKTRSVENGTILKLSAALPCRSCYKKTQWVDAYNHNICSDECHKSWNEYWDKIFNKEKNK